MDLIMKSIVFLTGTDLLPIKLSSQLSPFSFFKGTVRINVKIFF